MSPRGGGCSPHWSPPCSPAHRSVQTTRPSPRKATARGRPKARPRVRGRPTATAKPGAEVAAGPRAVEGVVRPALRSPHPSRPRARSRRVRATDAARTGNAGREPNTGPAATREWPARTARHWARPAARAANAGATRPPATAAAPMAPATAATSPWPAAAEGMPAIPAPTATPAVRERAAVKKGPSSTRRPSICPTPRHAAKDRCALNPGPVPGIAAFWAAPRARHVRPAIRPREASPIPVRGGAAASRPGSAPAKTPMVPARGAAAGGASMASAATTALARAVPAAANAVPARVSASAASRRTAGAAMAVSSSVKPERSAVWPTTARRRAAHPAPVAARPAPRRRFRPPAPNGWSGQRRLRTSGKAIRRCVAGAAGWRRFSADAGAVSPAAVRDRATADTRVARPIAAWRLLAVRSSSRH